jgi:Cytochrome C oxidase, cbb3-type, subunit III
MDFPFFHLDFVGNRMLIAFIAILHVLINHTLAVGFLPLMTAMEYFGYRKRKTDPDFSRKWDNLTYKMMFVAFIVTTTVGAMTGVGIWVSASLINPYSIGSLIRVFYGAWFTEWVVFVLEVVFIMIYFLMWKKSNSSDAAKKKHIKFGIFLSVFSWLTMAVIVAILGFMMDSGAWTSDSTFLSGVLNPLYLPQLYLRTPLAMALAGCFALFLLIFFYKNHKEVHDKAKQYISIWVLGWTPVVAAGAFAYYLKIPDAMIGNLPTAVGTMAFAQWYDTLLWIIIVAITVSIFIALLSVLVPKRIHRLTYFIPMIAMFIFMGYFERIREFIRKPYVIDEYMYSNTLRVEDYPLYKKDGLLKYATYSTVREITPANEVEAGKNIFMIACSRCHTVDGLNSIVTKFRKMVPKGNPVTEKTVVDFVPNMHRVWYYMPEFPGNEAELNALAKWIAEMDKKPEAIEGAQSEGVFLSSKTKKTTNNLAEVE